MRPSFISLRVVVAVAALIAVPAVAPPAQPTQAQLLRTYETAYAQKLTVSKTVATTTITHSVYSATDGIQTLASNGTNYDWAKLVLLYGEWPQSDNNVTVILRWMRQENGTNNWWNRDNPLNNGYGAPGAGGTGSNSNLILGAQHAAEALQRGVGGGYAGIVAALAANSDPTVTAEAIWASSWSTSHYANGTHWSTAPVPVVKAPASAW
jgi:Tfp pilus assembly protein FimT